VVVRLLSKQEVLSSKLSRSSIHSLTVMIKPFQGLDPGSTPGECSGSIVHETLRRAFGYPGDHPVMGVRFSLEPLV